MWVKGHAGLTVGCVYASVVGVAVVAAVRARVRTHTLLVDTAVTYAVGAVMWPFVWALVCSGTLQTPALGYLGLAWPMVLFLIDIAFVEHQAHTDPSKRSHSLQVDGNTLSGLALALGGLFVRHHVTGGGASTASPMIAASVLLILLVVTPSPSVHAQSRQANLIHALQKVVLQYCLGLIITMVCLSITAGAVAA